MGKRTRDRQPTMWVPTTELPTAASHPFYRRLNELLREHGFDDFVERRMRQLLRGDVGRLAHKAEHAIDLETGAIVGATVTTGC